MLMLTDSALIFTRVKIMKNGEKMGEKHKKMLFPLLHI